MRAGGEKDGKLIGKLVTPAVLVVTIVIVAYALHRYSSKPSTDDASIDADVVHVATTVGGKIVQITVAENSSIKAGDLLFQIDPVPYQAALERAEADLELSKANLDTKRRSISNQKSSATVANDQTRSASANLALAIRTVERLKPLAVQGYIPTQELDQAEVKQKDAQTALDQAREQASASVHVVDTEAAAEADVRAKSAAVTVARHNLDETTVKAMHDGRVVGLSVATGEVVSPSQSLFTLVLTGEWFAVANFRETDLKAMRPGGCATVYSMIDRATPIKGVIQGIGTGVLDSDKVDLPRSVPYVERSLNWVRVAQRFPVRIRLIEPDPQLVRLGASALAEIGYGVGCK